MKEAGGQTQTLFWRPGQLEKRVKTPKAQVPRSHPHSHPVTWRSLPAHGYCASCLQFAPGTRLRVCLISHLWPLGWDTACWVGGPGTAPAALDQSLQAGAQAAPASDSRQNQSGLVRVWVRLEGQPHPSACLRAGIPAVGQLGGQVGARSLSLCRLAGLPP